MPDYQNGMIYTIRCKTDPTLIYVGSTTNSLTKRFYNHKQDSNRRSSKVNKTMSEMGFDSFYIELYEMYPCNSKIELEKREGEVIREIGTLNEKIAGRDRFEYYKDNLDKYKENHKLYYEENKDKIREHQNQYASEHKKDKQLYDNEYRQANKEEIKIRRTSRITCSCGCDIIKDSQARHLRSAKHQELLILKQNQE
jgi:hypothetical protein